MDFIKKIMSDRKASFILLTGASVIVAVVFILGAVVSPQQVEASSQTELAAGEIDPAKLSMAVLNTEGLTCSSCIEDIQAVLAGLPGIGGINVALQSAKVEIFFDPAQVKNVDDLAAKVTEAGYASTVEKVLSPAEVQEELAFRKKQSEINIVKVGSTVISREDFDIELASIKTQYIKQYGEDLFDSPQGIDLLDNLKGQIIRSLIDDALLLSGVEGAGYTISEERLQEDYFTMIEENNVATEEEFKLMVENAGFEYDYFKKRTLNSLRIKNFVESALFKPENTDYQNQQAFTNWFDNTKLLTDVVFYDTELENLSVEKGNGGGSCSSGDGGC